MLQPTEWQKQLNKWEICVHDVRICMEMRRRISSGSKHFFTIIHKMNKYVSSMYCWNICTYLYAINMMNIEQYENCQNIRILCKDVKKCFYTKYTTHLKNNIMQSYSIRIYLNNQCFCRSIEICLQVVDRCQFRELLMLRIVQGDRKHIFVICLLWFNECPI